MAQEGNRVCHSEAEIAAEESQAKGTKRAVMMRCRWVEILRFTQDDRAAGGDNVGFVPAGDRAAGRARPRASGGAVCHSGGGGEVSAGLCRVRLVSVIGVQLVSLPFRQKQRVGCRSLEILRCAQDDMGGIVGRSFPVLRMTRTETQDVRQKWCYG